MTHYIELDRRCGIVDKTSDSKLNLREERPKAQPATRDDPLRFAVSSFDGSSNLPISISFFSLDTK